MYPTLGDLWVSDLLCCSQGSLGMYIYINYKVPKLPRVVCVFYTTQGSLWVYLSLVIYIYINYKVPKLPRVVCDCTYTLPSMLDYPG